MVIGIVPVQLDDVSAPAGCTALRLLRGRTLVARAVGALTRSGVVDQVVVVTDAALDRRVTEALATTDRLGVAVDVVSLPSVSAHRPGVVEHVLLALRAAADGLEVVIHDPLHPLAPSSLVRLVLETLRDDDACAAALPVRLITDSLKWVDDDDVVVGTADRDAYRTVYSPQAFRREGLSEALDVADLQARQAVGADVLARLVQQGGGRLLAVPAPAEVFRVSGADDLMLAEAMLAVGVDADDEAAPTRSSTA